MNYLQFNNRGKFEPEEQALANYFGKGNYVGFYRKRAKKNATSLVWHMNWLKKFILII